MGTSLFPDLEAGGNAGTALVVGTTVPMDSPDPPDAEPVEKPKPDAFDWYDNPDIVQFEVPSVAIYTNTVGNIVIRQRQEWDQDDDTFVFIAPANARRVAAAIMAAAGVEEPQAKGGRR